MRSLAGATGDETFRVCLITEIFHPEDHGGQGQQAFGLARRLRERGVGVSVLTRRNFRESSRCETLEGVDIVRLPPVGLLKGKGWAAALPTLVFIVALLARLVYTHRRYDLILVQGVKFILLPPMLAGWLFGKPCVVKIDAYAELAQDLTPESLARMGLRERSVVVRAWGRLRDALLRRADALVAISTEIARTLTARGLPAAKIVQIPNGIDLRRWAPAANGKRELRRRLGLPDGVLFTYAGRLSRAKGLVMLMETWQRIAPRYPQAHLVLVGASDRSFDGCEPELRKLAAKEPLPGRVTFTGQVDNVPDYLRASDLFVLCSEGEGFALSLVEAMAAGLPCISTAVGVAPEIIRNRVNGWLIPVNDAKALQTAIEDALDDPARWPALGVAAQRTVTARFDMDEVATRYIDLCRSLLPPVSAGGVQRY